MTFSRKAYSYFGGYTLRKYQGENLRSDPTLPIRSLPHDLVTGGIPLAGSRQSGLPFPSPGDIPNPGIELGSLALQADSLPSEPPGKLIY